MRILHSKDGQPLVKQLQLKIFHPGNQKFTRRVMRAPHKSGFHPGGIEDILSRTAEQIEKSFPGEEYRLVPVGPAAFNFVHAPKPEAAQGESHGG